MKSKIEVVRVSNMIFVQYVLDSVFGSAPVIKRYMDDEMEKAIKYAKKFAAKNNCEVVNIEE